jgi:phage terminase large subunit-like protein
VGRSRVAGWPPRWVSLEPTAKTPSRGGEAGEFIEGYCRVVKDSVGGRSGELIRLRPWQRNLTTALLAETPDGRLQHRTALIGMARKNGKSALGSGLALWGLFLGPDGGEVYSCAGTREQARIVFGTARRMVELDPELSSLAKVYRDAIEIPSNGSVYRPLSREAGVSEGLSPHLVIFDEVHVQHDRELWDVMELGTGARSEPLMVGITTAGARTDAHGKDSLCYGLYQYGRRVALGEIEDPGFFFAWWEPKAGSDADHRDPKVWAEANPGIGDLCAVEDFEAKVLRTPEAEFRTKRTNVWVSSSSSALPHGAWDKLADPDRVVSPDTPWVLMGDGSWSGDSTGILAVSVEERPHIRVVDLWERPSDDPGWRVPVADVEQAFRDACRSASVVEVGMDPYRWQRSMAVLENEGLPMVEFPMGSPARMIAAWKTFFDLVMDGGMTHDGDARLARHVEAMVLKIDRQGARPTKDAKMSAAHIDLGVCAVAGVDRAMWHTSNLAHVPEPDFLVL